MRARLVAVTVGALMTAGFAGSIGSASAAPAVPVAKGTMTVEVPSENFEFQFSTSGKIVVGGKTYNGNAFGVTQYRDFGAPFDFSGSTYPALHATCTQQFDDTGVGPGVAILSCAGAVDGGKWGSFSIRGVLPTTKSYSEYSLHHGTYISK